jgi:hypothetical protein
VVGVNSYTRANGDRVTESRINSILPFESVDRD